MASSSTCSISGRQAASGGARGWRGRCVCKTAMADNPWTRMTLDEKRTMLKMFTPKRELQPFVQLDHQQRRRDRVLQEIADVAHRQTGMSKQQVEVNIAALESLMPDLQPDLDRMRASDWVCLVRDVHRVARLLVVLKGAFPTANVSRIIGRRPKILLRSEAAVAADAWEVRAMLGERLPNLDAVVEACPDLLSPAQVTLSLSNLRRWFPLQNPFELLQKDPQLLRNIEECDLQVDPTYGWTSNFFNTGCMAEI